MGHFDVDLDFGDRNVILSHIEYMPAVMESGIKHNSGIHITAIPKNPITGLASLNYKKAEELGYFKLDLLNQSVYKLVKSPEHLEKLLSKEPNWNLLHDKQFVEKLVHIGNYYDLIQQSPEPIDSIEKLAMFLAIIRPGKKHLQGLPWSIVEKTVWDRENTDGYTFRKSHALAYSYLVILAMALLEELQ
jgi:hypothetical protein